MSLGSIIGNLFQGKKIKHLEDSVAEFHALQAEIDKARCVVEYTPNGNFLTVNQNWLKALGYRTDEMLGKNHFDFITQHDRASSHMQSLWSKLASGQNDTGQYRFVAKDGQVHWFQGYFSPIPNAKGDIYKVTSYMTDITEERNKAIKLQGEDEALNKSFGVFECDITGVIVDCNQLFLDQIGYNKNELLGKSVSLFLPPEVANSLEYKAMWNHLSKGEMQVRQIKRISKSGEELWFQSNYVPIRDEGGDVNKVISYSVCITAEKKRTAEYEGQINAINRTQAVIEFDLSGKILKVNQNFCDAVGFSSSEVVGRHHSMFVSQDEGSSQAYKDFWHSLSLGKPDANVFKRYGKNGKEIWLQASYNPILDANGKVSKIVKYATDITDKKTQDADNQGQVESINRSLGVIEFSLDGKINRVNHIFAELTGYTESEILGCHHSMFVDEEYKNGAEYTRLWSHLRSGKFESGVFKRYGKGGKQIWLQASYNPILDADGKPFKVVKFAIDVTEQHIAAQILSDAVSETQEVIEAAKLGDLSNRVSLSGKSGAIASLCDGVNALMDKITEVIIQVKEAGETINTAAGEISSGNTDLSSRTEQQASSLEETAASMEELASTVKNNAENAKQANQLATAASGVAVKGGSVVGQVVNTMEAINQSAHKIEDIISVIDGIAFQTNILALNAAVEAARAGEQGRGFAVVAGEVRNLAQRSASAAKEIKELITDSVNKTLEGTKQVENAGATMQEIVASVQRVTDIMGEIAAASIEQSAGIDQVNTAVTSMDEVTQQNAALVEQAAAAAESLVDQAVGLMDTVNAFKLNGGLSAGINKNAGRGIQKQVSRTVKKPALPSSVKLNGTLDDADWEAF